MLDAGRLALVVRAGAGYNTIDVATASRRGIYVSNCPGKNAIAVAELAFALLLALDRRVADNVSDFRAGKWNKKEYSKARGLLGRTLGLLGFGNIGQEMAKRAHAFGMPIVVWSRRFASGQAESDAYGIPMQVARTPQEVAGRSDVLSVHLALNADTRGLVNASILDRLKPGSFVINTARAEVMDYAALEKAVREKQLRVGLDVFALGDEVTGESPQLQDVVVDRGRRDERAESVAPGDQVVALQDVERLAERHQRHAERLRKLTLVVETGARREISTADPVTQRLGDTVIARHASVQSGGAPRLRSAAPNGVF